MRSTYLAISGLTLVLSDARDEEKPKTSPQFLPPAALFYYMRFIEPVQHVGVLFFFTHFNKETDPMRVLHPSKLVGDLVPHHCLIFDRMAGNEMDLFNPYDIPPLHAVKSMTQW